MHILTAFSVLLAYKMSQSYLCLRKESLLLHRLVTRFVLILLLKYGDKRMQIVVIDLVIIKTYLYMSINWIS
ncbi:hypothetical protein V1478_016752 [Vespula squamosa]|uniref:Uncharacterized protein n=1 Tax=Vespula squamosa TaxID=30214 RepID=A0ABD2A0P7_VESSQ